MNKLRPILFWLICAIAAIIPTVYFFLRLSDSTFRDSAMGNWFATMIGAIFAILIALEINKKQQETQERNEHAALEKEERDHKAKILKLLKIELEYNHTSLINRQPKKKGETKRKVFVNRLKDELWNSFSDGGELQWIKDLELLDFLSTAYYHIRTIIFLEEKYFDATHFPGLIVTQDKYPKDNILEYLTKTDPAVLEHVAHALDEIDKSLSANASKKPSQA